MREKSIKKMITYNNPLISKGKIIKILFLLLFPYLLYAVEYHVSVKGNDSNIGSLKQPFQTISAAAKIAMPGDTITVHKGTYREWINPLRGGSSDDNRIVYRAAQGEKVEIKGSEVISNWKKVEKGIWKAVIPNTFFESYNPYKDSIAGDWFKPQGRVHHTGEVYINGTALYEEVAKEKMNIRKLSWYCEVDENETHIWANFGALNPKKELTEINVRKACFYPDKPNRNYITVSGFTMRHAASQWAPPTAEQKALIGTHWSKGWIIENNIISDSKCVGLTLGKYGDTTDNTSGNSAGGYVGTIKRALKNGWSKDTIGSHIVRNNTIYNCGAAGICGSLGGIFSQIIGNHIYNINLDKPFTGYEMAGIKFHAPIDMLIKGNRIHHTSRGIWLDWMTQGTRVTSNILYENGRQDLYIEVNHGPFVVDNNILLTRYSLKDRSEGGTYAHNLFYGKIDYRPDGRWTPYHKEHSTEIVGIRPIKGGDTRFYNNMITSNGLSEYNNTETPCTADGNVYVFNAKPLESEEGPLEIQDEEEFFKLKMTEENDELILNFKLPVDVSEQKNNLVTTALLGKTVLSNAHFMNFDGSPLKIDMDFKGVKRNTDNPIAGPFEQSYDKPIVVKVW
ncbi:right-handed parallel beta-helix repeat-containing protein [Zobellia russellii]|uniref:right-handed parallel beta-helix repeat-containing protein n=1 Tax=Zobellia russellii TaxID=248907 RepID=UPI001BFEFDD0|nr:right-handed parallel beta-helix repeat-containing protein [Zobellia russellii]MBT9190555.1 right-handed parallel beta-helix repeat-containing protein [Zobellia russellii]